MINNLKNKFGFTLPEVLVYLAIFALIFIAVISYSLNLLKSYNKFLAKRELQISAIRAMDSIISEIKFAKSVYTPTSVFDSDNGQLSLETKINPPQDESSTYNDIYLDNYRIYIKKEGSDAQAITSEKVKITSLKFLFYNQNDRSQSVSVILVVENNLPENLKEVLEIRSGATVRGNY